MKHSNSRSLIIGATLLGSLLASQKGLEMGSSKSDDYSKETPVVRHNTANKVTTLIPIAPNTPVTKKEITETPLSDRDILHKLGYTDQQIELMSEPLIQKITKEHRLSQIKTIKDIRELIAIFNSEAAPLDQELRQLSLEQISYNNTSDAMSTLLQAMTEQHLMYGRVPGIDIKTLREVAKEDIELEYLYNIYAEFAHRREMNSLKRLVEKRKKGPRQEHTQNTQEEDILIDGLTEKDMIPLVRELAERSLLLDPKATDEKQVKIYQAWLQLMQNDQSVTQ